MELPLETWVWLGSIVLLASTIQGLTGFAFALVSLGLMPIFLELRLAIALTMGLGMVGNLVLMWRYRAEFGWREGLPMVCGALVGLIPGTLLQRAQAPGLLELLGVVLTGYGALTLWGPLARWQLPDDRHAPTAGVLSGLLSGAIGAGGPPVVIYCAARPWSPDKVRGRLVSFFFMVGCFHVTAYLALGVVTPTELLASAVLLPVMPVGLLLGGCLAGWLDAQAFRRVVLGLLIVMGLRMLAQSALLAGLAASSRRALGL